MAIIRWDPFREMTQVQNQFNRLVDQVWSGRQESWLPAVDVFDKKDAVVLKAELAGMDPDDIEIEVEDNVLTIKGERKFEEQVEDERYYRVERRFGSFQRSLALPQGVKADEIQAGYEDGILTVTVPKAEEEKPQRIEVKAKKTVEATAGTAAELTRRRGTGGAGRSAPPRRRPGVTERLRPQSDDETENGHDGQEAHDTGPEARQGRRGRRRGREGWLRPRTRRRSPRPVRPPRRRSPRPPRRPSPTSSPSSRASATSTSTTCVASRPSGTTTASACSATTKSCACAPPRRSSSPCCRSWTT